jgi:hypothetical protein
LKKKLAIQQETKCVSKTIIICCVKTHPVASTTSLFQLFIQLSRGWFLKNGLEA